ncbi:MAG: tetratricopeptide repeat protein [Cyanobacteria bacterium P01_D01_bin.36]
MRLPIKTVCRRQAAKLMYRRGVTYAQQQSFDAAVNAFTQAMEKDYLPLCDAQVMRGINRVKLRDMEGAIADFEAVIQSVSTSSELLNARDRFPVAQAHYHRGCLRQQAGNEAGALADWSAAIAHHPNYPKPHYKRALAHLSQGLHNEALADFDAAIAGDPTFAMAYFQRGNLRCQLGDMSGAAMDWELAVCNDFTLEAAKQKLEKIQQVAYDAKLSEVLAVPLAELNLTAKVKFNDQKLEIHVHREVGTGISYYTLPDIIRQHLVPLHLAEVSHFQLIGRAGGVKRPDWNQVYDLYKGQPCPPSNWQAAISTIFLFPPFAIPAFLQAAQVQRAYSKGKYSEALRASKAVKGLCVASSVALGFFTLLPLGYAAYDSMREDPTFKLAERSEQADPSAQSVNRPYQDIFN